MNKKKDKKEKRNGLKNKCCEKYKKNESKRCKRCPCYDLK
jgi:hypothetical protein